MCRAAVEANAKSAADYMSGKEKALKALVGAVMRESKGRADARVVEAQLRRILAGD
jgi:aspartyl-tRNA(Asn)/glutamyl-tRNA(Gln) amidotransferase subunit B